MYISINILTTFIFILLTYAKKPNRYIDNAESLTTPKTGIVHKFHRVNDSKSIYLNSRDISDRVINGTIANINDFPFAVFLYGKEGSSGKACSGTLIASNVVVTAAHCLFDSKSDIISTSNIFVGAGSINAIDKNPNIYVPAKVIVNPQYSSTSFINDIGLIILSKDIPSNLATPTKIYNKNVYDSMSVLAAGWGATSNSQTDSDISVLQYVDIAISSSKACSDLNSQWKGNDDYSICAEVVDGKDTCYGDSGGPLVAFVPGLMPLVGLTSSGNTPGSSGESLCGQQGGVAYYTNVNYFVGWISKETSLPVSQLLYSPEDISPPKTTGATSSGTKISKNMSSPVSILEPSVLFPLSIAGINIIVNLILFWELLLF